MGIWYALYVFAIVSIVKGSNYDAYLVDLDLRNRELHDSFRRKYPSGAYVLDYILPSPEFRLAHPVLQEYDSEVDYHQAENDDWERLLESLAFVQHTARHPDIEGAAKRFQSWLTEQPKVNSTPARARVYPAYAGSEFAPQDTTWGIHRVSGGSSEVGRWMDYAVLGAQAQEDEDDDDEDSDEALGAQRPSFRSEVKMDQLPAYCDPPNPCPMGYDPDTMATPCDRDVENTAEFNRNWILRKVQNGECSCDEEHMESCPSVIEKGRRAFGNLRRSQIKQISFDENPYLHGQKRSNLVAKTYHELKSTIPTNPYFRGHRLRSIIKKSGPHF